MLSSASKSEKVERCFAISYIPKPEAAKRTLRDEEGRLRPKLLAMRQWGVAVPGGAQALCHWRSTVEEAARAGIIDPVVIADLDMANFFNSVEWPRKRESISRHFPEASAVVHWEQRAPGVSVLPDGAEFQFDRGAEQGETFGPVKSVLPLGDARGAAAEAFAATSATAVCDEWFVDDGQLVCAPRLLDPWLRLFDAAISGIGASRGSGPGVKSVARLVCPPGSEQQSDGWATDYVCLTCRVPSPNSSTVVLGATLGSDDEIRAGVRKVCDKVAISRLAIAEIDHVGTELVLTRRCADVAKMSFCCSATATNSVGPRRTPSTWTSAGL